MSNLILEIKNKDQHLKIYFDGRVEGAVTDTVIINHYNKHKNRIIAELQKIKDKLMVRTLSGFFQCFYCQAREYPIDKNGYDISDCDIDEAGYAIDHAENCMTHMIDRVIKSLE